MDWTVCGTRFRAVRIFWKPGFSKKPGFLLRPSVDWTLDEAEPQPKSFNGKPKATVFWPAQSPSACR